MYKAEVLSHQVIDRKLSTLLNLSDFKLTGSYAFDCQCAGSDVDLFINSQDLLPDYINVLCNTYGFTRITDSECYGDPSIYMILENKHLNIHIQVIKPLYYEAKIYAMGMASMLVETNWKYAPGFFLTTKREMYKRLIDKTFWKMAYRRYAFL